MFCLLSPHIQPLSQSVSEFPLGTISSVSPAKPFIEPAESKNDGTLGLPATYKCHLQMKYGREMAELILWFLFFCREIKFKPGDVAQPLACKSLLTALGVFLGSRHSKPALGVLKPALGVLKASQSSPMALGM